MTIRRIASGTPETNTKEVNSSPICSSNPVPQDTAIGNSDSKVSTGIPETIRCMAGRPFKDGTRHQGQTTIPQFTETVPMFAAGLMQEPLVAAALKHPNGLILVIILWFVAMLLIWSLRSGAMNFQSRAHRLIHTTNRLLGIPESEEMRLWSKLAEMKAAGLAALEQLDLGDPDKAREAIQGLVFAAIAPPEVPGPSPQDGPLERALYNIRNNARLALWFFENGTTAEQENKHLHLLHLAEEQYAFFRPQLEAQRAAFRQNLRRAAQVRAQMPAQTAA